MSSGRVLYWLLTGACFGFGVIAILSIGVFFLVAGMILLVIGAIRLGGHELWATLIGFGVLPAAVLLWDVLSTPWGCITPGVATSRTGVNYFNCVQTPVGLLTSYHVMAAGFIVLALAGVAWGLLARALRRPPGVQHAG